VKAAAKAKVAVTDRLSPETLLARFRKNVLFFDGHEFSNYMDTLTTLASPRCQ
jgi:prepilin-type processing-associated H-X9-DG protein